MIGIIFSESIYFHPLWPQFAVLSLEILFVVSLIILRYFVFFTRIQR